MAPSKQGKAKAVGPDIGSPAASVDGVCPPKPTRMCLLNQLHKTRLCLYHRKGICQYGDQCPFAHSEEELQKMPDLSKTRLCITYQQTGRCTDACCRFAHGEEQLRSTAMFYRKTLCFWNEKGKCRNGDQCRFAHGRDQLRQLPKEKASPSGWARTDFEASQNNNPPPPPHQLAERRARGDVQRPSNIWQEQQQQPQPSGAPAGPPPSGQRPDGSHRTPVRGLSGAASHAAAIYETREQLPMKVYTFAPSGGDQHPAMATQNTAEALHEKLETLCHQLTVLTEQCSLLSKENAGSYGGMQPMGKAAGMNSLFAIPHDGYGGFEGVDVNLTAFGSRAEAAQKDLWMYGDGRRYAEL